MRKVIVVACMIAILGGLGAGRAESQVLYGDVLQKQQRKHAAHAARYRRDMADMFGGYANMNSAAVAAEVPQIRSNVVDNQARMAAVQQRNAASAARNATIRQMYAGPQQHQWFATRGGGMVTREQLPQNYSYRDYQVRGRDVNANHMASYRPAHVPHSRGGR